MIAVDTNLLVRLATNDDAGAREAVVRLLDRSEVFVAKTVLLECEWVLRSRFDYPPAQVSRFLRYLLSLPQVQVEDEIAVLQAMKLLESNVDFADALHIASSGDREFVTLDATLVRRMNKSGGRVRLLRRSS